MSCGAAARYPGPARPPVSRAVRCGAVRCVAVQCSVFLCISRARYPRTSGDPSLRDLPSNHPPTHTRTHAPHPWPMRSWKRLAAMCRSGLRVPLRSMYFDIKSHAAGWRNRLTAGTYLALLPRLRSLVLTAHSCYLLDRAYSFASRNATRPSRMLMLLPSALEWGFPPRPPPLQQREPAHLPPAAMPAPCDDLLLSSRPGRCTQAAPRSHDAPFLQGFSFAPTCGAWPIAISDPRICPGRTSEFVTAAAAAADQSRE